MTSKQTASAPIVITLFGPMQVLIAGEPLPHLRSRKTLWLLALLILRQSRPVEREWLVGMFWPDLDLSQGFANLRPILSELRSALGSQKERLQSPDRHTLRLDLTGASVDLLTFDAAIKSGKLSELEQAVALYEGPLLEGCQEEWVPQERAVREQNCLLALLKLAEAALTSGNLETAICFYQRAANLDPWSDSAPRGWMEALAQSGDSNAAMQVYRKYRELLRSDPSAMPDESTSALYQRLRMEARKRAGVPPVMAEANRPAPTVTGYLPHPLTDIVGREDERLEVADRLRRSRLVTLIGLGGIGKTRLAIEVAAEVVREYLDGVWLVALESITSESLVLQPIASVFGLKETSGRTLLQSLTVHLRKKRLLLVLDNCEHLLEATARIAASLLENCPGVRILATSREGLGITGETTWAVPALTTPNPAHLPLARATLLRVMMGYEGVQLFVERAQALQKSFALTGENALAVAHVCFQLDGIPLAIELAAARVKAMTAEQVAERLNDRLSLLTGGSRTAMLRQQTLRATLDWSYALLSDPEKRLLWRLSVFTDGWSLEAAEAVCSDDGIKAQQILDLLTSLVDRSLVAYEERDSELGGRYRLLEMVRQYAAERLEASGETTVLGGRHSDWCLVLAQEADIHFLRGEHGRWLHRLEREHANLRTALNRCAREDPMMELQIATALRQFWYLRGYYSEGRKYLEEALAHAKRSEVTTLRAKALNGAGAMANRLGDYPAAQKLYTLSLQMRRELGDRQGVAESLNNLGNVAHHLGDYDTVTASYQETLQIFTDLGDRRNMAWSLCGLGAAEKTQGDYASAKAHYEAGLEIYKELGDSRGITLSLNGLGNILVLQGDYLRAQGLYEESLSLGRELRYSSAIGFSLFGLGGLMMLQGDYTTARLLLEENLSLCRESGDRYAQAWGLSELSSLARFQNDTDLAQSLCEESMRLFQDLADPQGIACTLLVQGRLNFLRGDRTQALSHFRESLKICRNLHHREWIEDNLRALATFLVTQTEVQKAVRLWGAAETLRLSLGLALSPNDRRSYNQQVEQARLAAGAEAFAAAWAEGSAMTREQMVDYALAATEEIPPRQ